MTPEPYLGSKEEDRATEISRLGKTQNSGNKKPHGLSEELKVINIIPVS